MRRGTFWIISEGRRHLTLVQSDQLQAGPRHTEYALAGIYLAEKLYNKYSVKSSAGFLVGSLQAEFSTNAIKMTSL